MVLRAVASLLLLSYWPLGRAERSQSPEPRAWSPKPGAHAPLPSAAGRAWSPEHCPLQGPQASLRGLPRAPPGSRDHLLSLEMTSVSQGPQAMSLTRENTYAFSLTSWWSRENLWSKGMRGTRTPQKELGRGALPNSH